MPIRMFGIERIRAAETGCTKIVDIWRFNFSYYFGLLLRHESVNVWEKNNISSWLYIKILSAILEF